MEKRIVVNAGPRMGWNAETPSKPARLWQRGRRDRTMIRRP